jgi:hypothetical protein
MKGCQGLLNKQSKPINWALSYNRLSPFNLLIKIFRQMSILFMEVIRKIHLIKNYNGRGLVI